MEPLLDGLTYNSIKASQKKHMYMIFNHRLGVFMLLSKNDCLLFPKSKRGKFYALFTTINSDSKKLSYVFILYFDFTQCQCKFYCVNELFILSRLSNREISF